VDRIGNYGLSSEQRPYRLEDVLAAHCRWRQFNEYFLVIMHEWSDEEIYEE
jgi:hypothetical protein